MGSLVFQATLGGQVNLNGPNTASTFDIAVPAITGTMVTTGDSGTVTNTMLAASAYNTPGTIGSGTANTGAFTTLSASSTVSGTGFSTYLASPPAIGGTTAASGKFSALTNTALTSGRVVYSTTGGLETDSANLLYSGTDLTVYGLTVGRGAGAVNTNVAFGLSSLSANTTGANNVSIGAFSLLAVTTANNNVGVGVNSLRNTTGASNTGLGTSALVTNTSGTNNVAVGQDALQANTTASNNTAVGYQAGYTQTTAAGNAFYGYQSGYGVTTGSKNVIIGSYNGSAAPISATGSNYIVLSDGDGNVRQTIDSSGNLLVGTTSQFTGYTTNTRLTVSMPSGSSGTTWEHADSSGASAPALFNFLNNANTRVGYIASSGTATSFSTSSDYRLKENILSMTGALAKVAALKPVTYKWKEDGSDGEGFIAHELAEVCPLAVNGEKDAVDAEGKPQYQGIDTSFLVATLTAAIQEQQALITSLTARIAALEST